MSDEIVYRDRTHNYVPTPMRYNNELHVSRKALVGAPGRETLVDLTLAQADELNRDPQSWWWAKVGDDPEHWSRFNGWDLCVEVQIEAFNRRDVNDWKGRDEIRKDGKWRLSFNGQVVAGGGISEDLLSTMLKIDRVSKGLQELPIRWTQDLDYRGQIEGRKVYYNSVPAELGYWMPDQNAVMVRAINGFDFPTSPYDIDEQTDTHQNPEHSYSDEFRHEAKVELLDPNLWWWRKREFNEQSS